MFNLTGKNLSDLLSIIPALTIILYIIKWFIKSESRSLIDELLDLRIANLWDRFQSAIFLSTIMMAAILSTIFMFDKPFISNIIFQWIWVSFFVFCLLLILVFWIRTFWKAMNKKFLTGIIVTFYLSLLLVPYVVIDSIKVMILSYINQYFVITVGMIFSLIFYNFIVLKICLSILHYFMKPDRKQYKLEKISSDSITQELEKLYFLFMYDNERHILAKVNNVKKIENEFFVYHPKENVMIRYFIYPESQ
ncbi:hypothetical protein Q9R46_16905 [Paenibacillus sp. RRE4]|uniref:hypothetical protein n=1 Tax=Paenibacillus sp. RRE4 TaxID=2962587 RepID=UPI002881C781|nr:hypothetical protein [Paenibacillus sp. RRE4]MDT0124341.1 hypothetical protein [Paenibacillus sp. RRE4]